MPPSGPSWWYDPGQSAMPWLLHPLAALYGALGERRLRQTTPYRSTLPVICVGNLTAGGAGKTPVACEIARLLIAEGRRPAFLSRGFGGRTKGPHRVDPARDTAAEVGDEPLLLARFAPTFIAAKRDAGARSIEQSQLADVIVMDDGFQNPQLAKDLSIIVLDGAKLIGNGRVIPSGPLRLPLEIQLARADAFVLLHSTEQHSQVAKPGFLTGIGKPVLTAAIVPEAGQAETLTGPLIAYAGIGRPAKFFETLRGLRLNPVEAISFPDHHPYSAGDAERLVTRANRSGARLITTEKDFVRLAGVPHLAELASRSTALTIGIHFKDGDERLMKGLLQTARKS